MVISFNCKTRFQILSMSNGKSENTRNMDSVEDPSKSLPTIVEEENRRNEEVEEVVENISNEIWRGNCNNEIKRKRGRPSEKDKEGLPESKKVKKSPRKKRNLKVMSINNGKPNGFNKLFKKKITEKCIFCQEEHFRETLWEGVG